MNFLVGYSNQLSETHLKLWKRAQEQFAVLRSNLTLYHALIFTGALPSHSKSARRSAWRDICQKLSLWNIFLRGQNLVSDQNKCFSWFFVCVILGTTARHGRRNPFGFCFILLFVLYSYLYCFINILLLNYSSITKLVGDGC